MKLKSIKSKHKILNTDLQRDYLSKQFEELCTEKGIIIQLTTPYTP